MRKKLVVVLALLCVLAFCMAPAAATTSSDQTTKKTGMTVTPIVGDVMWPKGSNSGTVTQGETKTYSYTVPAGSTTLSVKVVWGTTASNLGLIVQTPNSIGYGEFDDATDGSTNGSLALQFQDNPLQSGQWLFFVRGKSVTGSQSFTITIVSS
ncbi:hypothetical protein [Methanorbis furvi]|uniref:Uncharacterized protein n=1 Tax=Methanorbis furvi TaxID=3028299 RepID=A0AAE4MBT2_9EURY|nr:hypothetical protein [Methanocorpusculaceae archaeon Ag1]